MADLPAWLLEEQDRVRPILDRLLALAALWMDPDVPADATGDADGGKAWRLAGPADDEAPMPKAGRAPSYPDVVRPGAPAAAATTLPATLAATIAATMAGAVGGGNAAGATLARPPASGAAAIPPVMPTASLRRLRDRGARGGAAALATPSPTVATPTATRPSPFAALVPNAAEDAVPAGYPSQPAIPPSARGAEGSTAMMPTTPGGDSVATRVPTMQPGSLGTMVAAPRGMPPSAAMAALAAGFARGDASAELPGDALEELLADILERAAAEAGIALP